MQVHVQIMKHLDRQAHRVFLATNSDAETEFHLPEDVHIEKYNLGGTFRDEYGAFEHLRQLVRHIPVGSSLVRIARLIRHRRIDVIHCTSEPRAALMGTILSLLSGAKLVIQAHVWNLDRSLLKRIIVRLALSRADAVIAVSQFINGQLAKAGFDSAKIWTIWNAANLDAFHPGVEGSDVRTRHGIEPDTPLVVTVGRITHQKGHRYLLEALESVRREIPQVRALLVGWADPAKLPSGKTYEQELRELCADKGLEDAVIFAGPTTNIPEVWAAADVAVVPSIGAEAFGLVAVEAMATGKAVVGTDSGGLPEILAKDSGVVVPKGNAEALAHAITRMLKDDRLRERTGLAARKRVEESFHEARPAELVKDVYAGVLGRL